MYKCWREVPSLCLKASQNLIAVRVSGWREGGPFQGIYTQRIPSRVLFTCRFRFEFAANWRWRVGSGYNGDLLSDLQQDSLIQTTARTSFEKHSTHAERVQHGPSGYSRQTTNQNGPSSGEGVAKASGDRWSAWSDPRWPSDACPRRPSGSL